MENATATKLTEMFTANTGIHFMDSGGDNGRAWQRAQGRDFASEPSVSVDFSGGYADITRSAWHYLNDQLTYDADLTAQYLAFADSDENEDEPDLPLMEQFAVDTFGKPANAWNSYNWENLLDRVIQGVTVETPEKTIYILQIHGGADVRGGYTRPAVFTSTDGYLFGDADAVLSCGSCNADWNTDDAWHFYSDDNERLTVEDFKTSICPKCNKGMLIAS